MYPPFVKSEDANNEKDYKNINKTIIELNYTEIPHVRIKSSYFSTVEEYNNLQDWFVNNIQNPVKDFWKVAGKQTFSSSTVFLFIVDSAGNIKNKSIIFNNANEEVTKESIFALDSLHINDGPPLQHGNNISIEFTFRYNYKQPNSVYFRLYKDKQYETTENINSIETSKEYKEAFINYFKKLADDGNSTAQLVIANSYLYGNKVEQDVMLAAKYYKLATENKNKLDRLCALNTLGHIYAEGYEVERNLEKAFNLFKKAADDGYISSQINIARMYYFGDFVKKDLNKAYDWYKKALVNGNPVALYDIKILEKELF